MASAILSCVTRKYGAVVATNITSYLLNPERTSSNLIGFPPIVSQNVSDLPMVLLVTLNAYPLLCNDFATRVDTSPVPIKRICFVFNSSIFSSASFTAIDPTDMPPLPIPLEFLILVPILIALSNRVLRC